MATPPSRRGHRRAMPGRDPVLVTKITAPPPPLGQVRRPRLVKRLNESALRALTLISAPAGFGKTALLAEWRASPASGQLPTAWLSLEERDEDPLRFWTYVIAALNAVHAGLGRTALSLLQSPQPPPIETALIVLINAITAVPFHFALVLDDYHLIATPAINETLSFLLAHAPPQLHLILATRADPPLALARLRARGQLAELRAADLRFTPDEAFTFLTEVMNLHLSAENLAALEARTEGWIAGLQLAALSMRGYDDVSGFILAFTGSNRHILDYLGAEAFLRQPDDVQSFLLQTCILDRLTAPLCDVITGRHDSQAMLQQLERDNLFLLALDEERRWFRYHQLFAEALRGRLERTLDSAAFELHARAAAWHERHGSTEEAVQHALAARDFDRASRLLEQEAIEMLLLGERARLYGWIEALPSAYIQSRPWLNLASAWASLFMGQLDAVEPRLQEVERALGAVASGDGWQEESSDAERDALGAVALARAALASLRADAARTIEMCQQALAQLPSASLVLRGLAVSYLGSAYWLAGDVAAAENAVSEAIALSKQAGNTYYALTTMCMLGQLYMAQGKLRQAAAAYEEALSLAAREFGVIPAVAPANVGMSSILLEWNDLEGAARHAQHAIELGRKGGEQGTLILGLLALARARSALGDRAGALTAIDEAHRAAQQTTLPGYAMDGIAMWRARLDLDWGDVTSAANWARRRGESTMQSSVWLGDVEEVAHARLLIGQGEVDEALDELEHVHLEAEAAGRVGSVIECLALQALIFQAQGNSALALASVARALFLAEPNGYCRVFVGERTPMARLLARMLSTQRQRRPTPQHAASPEYVRSLLAKFGPWIEEGASGSHQTSVHGDSRSSVYPLSGRELEVLRLIAGGASNRDIARELIVSLGTVKKHLNNIFGKLGVHSRMQAVARARESGLLSV